MSQSKPKKGLFIVFEGSDGAGKSTIMSAIAEALAAHAVEVVKTREPGNTALGEKIRALLLQSHHAEKMAIGAKAELLLFLAARAQNIEETIKPSLERGAWVLCDRFNDSTIAYQGSARGLGIEDVESLCTWVCGDIVPDITFFLTVDPDVALKRVRQEGALDRIESEESDFQARVLEGFHHIAILYPNHFTVINANRDKDQVIEDVWKVISDKLEL